MPKKSRTWEPIDDKYGAIWRPGKVFDGGGSGPIGTITLNWTLTSQDGDAVIYTDEAPIITGIDVPPSLMVGQLGINNPQNYRGDFPSNQLTILALYNDGDTRFAIGNVLDTAEAVNPNLYTGFGSSALTYNVQIAGLGNKLGVDPEVALVLPLYPATLPEIFPHNYWVIYPYDFLAIWPETEGFDYYDAGLAGADNILIDQEGNRLPPAVPNPTNLVGTLNGYSSFYYRDELTNIWKRNGGSIEFTLIQEGVKDYTKYAVVDFNDGQEKFLSEHNISDDGPLLLNANLWVLIQEDAWTVDSGEETKISLEVFDGGYYTYPGYPTRFERIGSPNRLDNYLVSSYSSSNILGGLYEGVLTAYQFYDSSDNIILCAFELELTSQYKFRVPIRLDILVEEDIVSFFPRAFRSPTGLGHTQVLSYYEYSPDIMSKLSPTLETIEFGLRVLNSMGTKNSRGTIGFSAPDTLFEGLPIDSDIEDLSIRFGLRASWFDLPLKQIIGDPFGLILAPGYSEFVLVYTGLLIRTSVGHCLDIGFRPRQLDRLANSAGVWKVVVSVSPTSTTLEFTIDLGAEVEDKLYEYTFPITESQWSDMQSTTWAMSVTIERPE